MRESHYNTPQVYTIYALTLRAEDGHWFYIGKTTSRRLSAVYSTHICGRCAATEGCFTHEGRPELYLLERVTLPRAEAYRHVVAWVRVFLDEGYDCLNHEGTDQQARALLPETARLVAQLCQTPFPDILRKCRLNHPRDGDLPPLAASTEEMTQMNVRIRKTDKAQFDVFCKRRKLSQKEGFALLLDAARADRDGEEKLLKSRGEQIETLRQEKEKLAGKLKAARENTPLPPEARAREELALLQKGIPQYLSASLPTPPPGRPLPQTSYRRFVKNLAYDEKPRYPEAEGFLVIAAKALLWGSSRHRACFLVGRGADGTLYRIRMYPREDFVGVSLRDSPYAREDSRWYVGVRQAKDGAMDLICALPLPALVPAERSGEKPKGTGPSLSQRIADAEKRR